MSSYHISNFRLNTWSHTPYFEAHAPAGLNVTLAAVDAQAYLNLPPGIRSLCEAAHAWATANGWSIAGYSEAYDSAGRELSPATGKPEPLPEPLRPVIDIELPSAGWPDPTTWEPAPLPDEEDEPDPVSIGQILSDVASHGVERTADEYGMSVEEIREILRDQP